MSPRSSPRPARSSSSARSGSVKQIFITLENAARERQPSRSLTMQTLRRFLKDDIGATAIEYGLIAALVSVVIIVALTTVGTNLTATFDSIGTALAPAGG